MIETLEIDQNNRNLVLNFLTVAGKALETFRYFSNRSLSVLDNHLCTLLLLIDKNPVCYGHLDKDGDNIWLGIAVAEKYQGQGLGSLMLNNLLEYSKANNVDIIYLTVDRDNIKAISLYEKNGFIFDKNLKKNILRYKNYVQI